MADYTSLWEAFSTGWGGGQYGDISPDTADWQSRSEAFYSQQIGPAFGAADFGETTKYLTPLNIQEVEQAEEQFRMSIGDPYGGTGQDPFAWETLSRYSPEEAQKMLEGELYGRGGLLGGETGTTYGSSLEKTGETFTSSTREIGESLTYGGLTSDISLQSGTSGLALKTGSGTKQAENVLSEAYMKSKSLGGTYLESQRELLSDLKTNLNTALTTYISTIDEEKEQWYQNILSDVQRAEGLGAFEDSEEVAAGLESLDLEGEGLAYTGEESEFRDTACGIGELYNPDTGDCEAYEDIDLLYGEYGYEDREIVPPVEAGPILDPSDPGFDPSEFFDFSEPPPAGPSTGIPGEPIATEDWDLTMGGATGGGFGTPTVTIGGDWTYTGGFGDWTLPVEEEEEEVVDIFSESYTFPSEEPYTEEPYTEEPYTEEFWWPPRPRPPKAPGIVTGQTAIR